MFGRITDFDEFFHLTYKFIPYDDSTNEDALTSYVHIIRKADNLIDVFFKRNNNVD